MKKRNKNLMIFFGMFIIMLFLFMNFASAQVYDDLRASSEQIIQWINDIFSPFFHALLGADSLDKYFFERILILILVYVVVWSVLKKVEIFKDHKGVVFVVSLIVALLGARYMSEIDILEGILLPYGTLAIAISVALPFLIYFFFVNLSIPSKGGRRIAWILFAAVFFGLWISRGVDSIGNIGNWIYGIGVVAVLLCLIFDDKIQEYFGMFEATRARRIRFDQQIADREAQLVHYRGIQSPSQSVKDTIKRYEDEIKELYRQRRK
ncbi:hypothetical protein HYW76_00370 [Candidatus Pacearchaeota archaeon]|nr:hypothetical protein [Candidatus Pacearchaeota archaeon]